MSACEADWHVVGFLDFVIDDFLEVQNQKYSWILYLIDYIAYGLHLWYKIYLFKEICRKPITLHPGLGSSLPYVYKWHTPKNQKTEGSKGNQRTWRHCRASRRQMHQNSGALHSEEPIRNKSMTLYMQHVTRHVCIISQTSWPQQYGIMGKNHINNLSDMQVAVSLKAPLQGNLPRTMPRQAGHASPIANKANNDPPCTAGNRRAASVQ